jgi:DNA-3-methyladenine glycosylase I
MAKVINVNRCDWCLTNTLYKDYHDLEWGKPCFDDQQLFENLSLEAFQSGLNWLTILKKREAFRTAFANFKIETVATYNSQQVEALLKNKSIVRHRGKINATITNAKQALIIQQGYQSLSNYFWSFVNHQPIVNSVKDLAEVPSTSLLSKTIAKDLAKKGFKFIGPTSVYAFMQASGLVNDHLNKCSFK